MRSDKLSSFLHPMTWLFTQLMNLFFLLTAWCRLNALFHLFETLLYNQWTFGIKVKILIKKEKFFNNIGFGISFHYGSILRFDKSSILMTMILILILANILLNLTLYFLEYFLISYTVNNSHLLIIFKCQIERYIRF